MLRLIRTQIVIPAEFIEIDTVCAGVRKYAVQNDGNAVCFCLLT